MSEIVKHQMASAIEQVVINGDLSKLTPDQRVTYVKTVCDSLHLNPTTRPFEYIVLNGKLTLYATRSASEQLRKIHGVSILSLDRTMMTDVGLYQVVARGRDSHGREDEASGVVNIGGLKGENLANALLKCETKAKRRLTLSICGLGFLDETEVSDIPGATTPAAAPVVARPAPRAEAIVSTASGLERLRAKVGDITMPQESGPEAVSEQPQADATPVPRKGGGAPVPIPASAPASEGDGEYIRVQFRFVDLKQTKTGQTFVSVKTTSGDVYNCWDSSLGTVLTEIGTGTDVDLLVEYPPADAPKVAKPKIVEIRRVAKVESQETETVDLPF